MTAGDYLMMGIILVGCIFLALIFRFIVKIHENNMRDDRQRAIRRALQHPPYAATPVPRCTPPPRASAPPATSVEVKAQKLKNDGVARVTCDRCQKQVALTNGGKLYRHNDGRNRMCARSGSSYVRYVIHEEELF